MKQRDALLAGAKKCLVEKGYSHTTARDIAAASGAHLGSIGYHFGSKDRLMHLAAVELSSEWGDTLLRVARAAGGDTPAERLHAFLTGLLASLPASGEVQSASVQALAQARFDDELRRTLAEGLAAGRAELAAIVLGRAPAEPDAPEVRALGTLVHALTMGLVAQALVDPAALPDPDTLAATLRVLGQPTPTAAS
ncbi:TetR/AcrR family transcriptional regulator [Streptomyces sp. DSM 44915]|uniref:TetR/AcrR family transcriptional regulator n=1 Tax=Streptomyces chisholmiae TaxID=3075540 RepID=A0ABU2JSF6_9ACTN|nr:TetR/AcrR family transcriptional regulator [Streptomyces sp. DSM 44915]MDT0267926.1 TetR/AcrR family transcriptional regulator [Streptomyces sp. DSM 44915]